MASGPEAEFHYPDHVVWQWHRPFHPEPLMYEGFEYLVIRHQVIHATIVDGGLMPLPGIILVLPDWSEFDSDKLRNGLYHPPQTARNQIVPPRYGTVVRVNGTHDLAPGDRVVIPALGGMEIGFIDRNYYLISEDDILATIR